MDASAYQCPNCGANVDVNFKTRKGHCDWCGSIVTFPRKAFNSDVKVLDELKHCQRCFSEKRLDDAKEHAENVLAIAIDNAIALYVRAYYESFSAVNKNSARMGEYFEKLFEIEEMDYDEIESMKQLFLDSKHKLENHEAAVLRWACANLEGDELREFVDEFCPPLIVKRINIDFFTPELAELYKQVTAACTAPKTCYALLQAITANPDSPYPNNRFFLKTKTQRFYHDFLLPLGGIIQSMATPELQTKFYRVYQSKLGDFENKMNGGNN